MGNNENEALIALGMTLEANVKNLSKEVQANIKQVQKNVENISVGVDITKVANGFKEINELAKGVLKDIDLTKQFNSIFDVFADSTKNVEDYLNVLGNVKTELVNISKIGSSASGKSNKNILNALPYLNQRELTKALNSQKDIDNKRLNGIETISKAQERATNLEIISRKKLRSQYAQDEKYINAIKEETVSGLLSNMGIDKQTNEVKQEVKEYSELTSLFSILLERKEQLGEINTKSDAEENIKLTKTLLSLYEQIETKRKMFGSKYKVEDISIGLPENYKEINQYAVYGSINQYIELVKKEVNASISKAEQELSNYIINRANIHKEKSDKQYSENIAKIQKKYKGSSSGGIVSPDIVENVEELGSAAQRTADQVEELDDSLNGSGNNVENNELDLWKKSAENLKEEFSDVIKYAVDVETTLERLEEIRKKLSNGVLNDTEQQDLVGYSQRYLSLGKDLTSDQEDDFYDYADDYKKMIIQIQNMTESQLKEIEKLKAAKKELDDSNIVPSSSSSGDGDFRKPSKEIEDLIQRVDKLETSLSEMQTQLSSLSGEAFEKMKNDISNVKTELNETIEKLKELNVNSGNDLEQKLKKMGLTFESVNEYGQLVTDTLALDDKTGFFTENDNIIETVTKYHDKIKDTNAYIQQGNDLIEERAILLKKGLQVGEEYVMSDATGKVDIGNGIKKYGADSVLHTHAFSNEVNNLRFSDADIRELVDGTVKKALLLCGDEIATLDMTNVDASKFEALKTDILGAYTAVFARFGAEVKDGKLVDINTLPPEIQNQATDIVNNLIRNIMKDYGGDLVFDKISNGSLTENDAIRLPQIDSSEMEIVQKYLDAVSSNKPAENIIALQKQFGVLKTEVQEVQQEVKEVTAAISNVGEGSNLSSPTQTFDNEIQKDLVYLKNYKNTIEEINKLKLEPQTDEIERKLVELQKLADYFFASMNVTRNQWGNDGANFVDYYGTLRAGLSLKGYGDSIFEIYKIGKEIQNSRGKLNVNNLTFEFSGITEEISRIESKSEGLRNALTKDLTESSKYVSKLRAAFVNMADTQEELKTETSPKWIEGYNKDINKWLTQFPELIQFKDKFLSYDSAIEFVKTDAWMEFVATLPQARTYLESIGYEFKEISKNNQTSSPTLFEDESGQLTFVEQTEKAVDLIEEESGQMAMFETTAEKATDSAIEGQMTLNDILDKNIEGQMTLNDLANKQDVKKSDSNSSLFEEPSGQLAMFEGLKESQKEAEVAVEKTNDAIEGQIELLDYLEEKQKESQNSQDTSDTSENISKIDKLKKKIEELGFSARETASILKSIDDSSKFWIGWEDNDGYKKIQKLLSYLKEYGYLVKNVKEDTDAFSYSGNISSVENEKSIKETAKAYETLTKQIKTYYTLKNKEIKGNVLSDTEKTTLSDLETKIKDATAAQGKYANATGQAAIAQQEFNDTLKKFKENSGQSYVEDITNQLNNLAATGNKTKAYETRIGEIRNKLKELKGILPIDFTNDTEVDQLKAAKKEIDKLVKSLSGNEFKIMTEKATSLSISMSKYLNQNSAMPKEFRVQIEALRDELDQARNSVEGINKVKLDKITSQFNTLISQVEATGKTGVSMLDKIKHKIKDLGAYIATYVSFQDAIQVIRQGFETIKEYDTALTEMNKVSEESISVLKEFQKESFKLADNIGTTAYQFQNSVADWQRLGESLEEAKQSAQDANILLNVSEFESIDEATESLVSMSQAFKDLEKGEIIDVVNNLGNNFAISTDGLATALKDSASSLQTAQNDFFESAALITAANTVVQDPSKVGAGIRTIALRLTGTEAARAELEALGEDVDDFVITTTSTLDQQIKDLTKTQGNFGVSLLDMNGNYRSTYEVLLDIAKVWDQIAKEDLVTGENRQNALLEMMAGEKLPEICGNTFYRTHLTALIA